MAPATADIIAPMITLHIEAGQEGEVTPVMPVTWTFSEDLVNMIQEKGLNNPYLIIIVGYEVKEDYGYTTTRFHPTKVYARKLLDTPKEYIQFSKAGKNVVLGFVINVHDSEAATMISGWKARPDRMPLEFYVSTGTYKLEVNTDGDARWDQAMFKVNVTVDADHFARAPRKSSQLLVRQFFRNKEFDQCDFRRRFLISLALSVPVQIYGIFARLFTLFYAVVFAKRDMQFKLLFALNPHDFGMSLGTSFWYMKKGSYFAKRTSALKWLSPPQLILYVLMLTGVVLPGFVIALLSHLVTTGTGSNSSTVLHAFSVGDVVISTLITDPILAVIIYTTWLFMSDGGKRARRQWAAKRNKAGIIADPNMFDLLREQAAITGNVTAGKVENKTFHLKFHDLKMKVCKPFARVS